MVYNFLPIPAKDHIGQNLVTVKYIRHEPCARHGCLNIHVGAVEHCRRVVYPGYKKLNFAASLPEGSKSGQQQRECNRQFHNFTITKNNTLFVITVKL
jgi:hypothetical protein